MLPSIEDWLSASWADYKRRFWALISVLAVGGLVTAFAVLLPLVPAGLAAYLHVGPPWLIWSAASSFSLLAGLYLSTWAQAAAVRAAAVDEDAGGALRTGWRQTPAFAWVLSLVLLAAGGGFVLLILPGLVLSVLLFFAPFYQMSGEDEGRGALELSYARVRPLLGAVSARLALIAVIACLPAWTPWVGWLIGPLWAPLGLVACARLAADLKTAAPAPARPSLGPAVGALSAVLVLAMFAASYGAARGAMALRDSYMSGSLAGLAPDPVTAQSLLALLSGQGSDVDVQRSLTYVIALSSAVGKAP